MLVHCGGDRSLFDPGERGTHPQIAHLDYYRLTSSFLITLVLLRRTRVNRGELHSLFFLQRFRHLEGSRRALAEPQKVLGLEMPNRRRRFLCIV